MKIYLAGPIGYVDYSVAHNWRVQAHNFGIKHNIEVIDPTRHKGQPNLLDLLLNDIKMADVIIHYSPKDKTFDQDNEAAAQLAFAKACHLTIISTRGSYHYEIAPTIITEGLEEACLAAKNIIQISSST